MVMKQLRCGGALGAVQVFRAGFPNRMDFMSFVSKFGCLAYPSGSNPMTRDLSKLVQEARRTQSQHSWKQAAVELIELAPLAETVLNILESVPDSSGVDMKKGLQMGKSQVFLRAEVYDNMERLYYRTANLVALRMQFRFKAYKMSKQKGKKGISKLSNVRDLRREYMRKIVNATIILQRRARVFLAVNYKKKIVRLVTLLAARYRGWKGRERVKAIKGAHATTIQTSFRRFRAQKRYRVVKQIALNCQRLGRGWLVRSAKARALKKKSPAERVAPPIHACVPKEKPKVRLKVRRTA